MKINDTRVTIQRGEAFTIDFSFTNKDGSPFVVSNELVNPYAKISIASNSFSTKNQYVYNQWCDLTNFYKFISTKVCDLSDANTPGILAPITDWSNATLPSTCTHVGSITVNGSTIYYCSDTIFSVTDASGNTTYKLCLLESDDIASTQTFVEYQFRLVVGYTTDITSTWSSQNYSYKINLVTTAEPVADNMDDEDITETMSVPLLANGEITVLNSIGGNN